MHIFKKFVFIAILCFAVWNLQSDSGCCSLENADFRWSAASLDCRICGPYGVLPKSRVSDSASIGILHLRTLQLYDTQVGLSADSKNDANEQDSFLGIYCNFGEEYGCARITSMPNRGIATVNIAYGSHDEIDFGLLEEQLCSECMGKILAACGEGGEDLCRNVFLVDFRMAEFYPLPENIVSFMRNDYYFHVDHGQGEDRVLIVYAPVFTVNSPAQTNP